MTNGYKLKIKLIFSARYRKEDATGADNAAIFTEIFEVLHKDTVDDIIESLSENLLYIFETHSLKGSGWALDNILKEILQI